jgi:hypothetical protein
MEFVLDLLKYARDVFGIFISGLIIVRSLRSQRFHWGLSPKGPQAPVFLMRAWFLFGGTYAMWWSSVQFGLDSHRPVTGGDAACFCNEPRRKDCDSSFSHSCFCGLRDFHREGDSLSSGRYWHGVSSRSRFDVYSRYPGKSNRVVALTVAKSR